MNSTPDTEFLTALVRTNQFLEAVRTRDPVRYRCCMCTKPAEYEVCDDRGAPSLVCGEHVQDMGDGATSVTRL